MRSWSDPTCCTSKQSPTVASPWLDILAAGGEGAIGLGDLTLFSDPATERAVRRLHVAFPCPSDPLEGDMPTSERLGDVGDTALARARALVGRACQADSRFQAVDLAGVIPPKRTLMPLSGAPSCR